MYGRCSVLVAAAAGRHRRRFRDRVREVVAGAAREVFAPRPTRGSSRDGSRVARRHPGAALLDRARPASGTSPRWSPRSRRNAQQNPHAQVAKDATVEQLLGAPYFSAASHARPPADLRRRRGRDHRRRRPPVTSRQPGLDPRDGPPHRVAPSRCGTRWSPPSSRPSTPGWRTPVDVAELMVNYSPEELILRDALGLGDGTTVNPSGGPLRRAPGHGHRPLSG